MKILRVILFVVIANQISAQVSQKPSFSEVSTNYLKGTPMAFEVDVYGYRTPLDKKADFLGHGKSEIAKNYKYSKFGENEFFQRDNFTITVNHSLKKIAVFESPLNIQIKEIDISGLNSVLKNFDSLYVYKGTKNNLKEFVLSNPQSEIIETHLFVNVSTNLIEKIVYYYNTNDDLDYIPEYSSVTIYYKKYITGENKIKKYDIADFVVKTPKGYLSNVSLKGFKVEYYNNNRKSNS